MIPASLHTHCTSFTPPKSDSDFVNLLRLIRSRRVGPTTFHKLMRTYGSVQAAIDALPNIARDAGVKDYAVCCAETAQAEFNQATKLGYQPLCFGAPDYPALLAETSDAPPFLWTLGKTECLKKPMIAIVGARNASSLGRRMTHMIAEGLAEAGFTVVSGLARGIDAAAHTASLKSGTVAVVAGGLNTHYPKENKHLYQDIPEHGLLMSEQSSGLVPQARHFPMRNRIIAGLAKAVIVMEAAARSGSLITARNALDLGRDVMAVPGHPFDGRAAGCNFLIRDGAVLVRSVQDVTEVLGDPLQKENAPEPKNPIKTDVPTEDVSAKILTLLQSSAVSEDIVIRDSGLPAKTVSQYLMDLELQGRIERHPGGLLALAG